MEYGRFHEKTLARDGTSADFPLLEWHDRVLRTVLTTLGAAARALANLLFGSREPVVELAVGDRAPDFSLRGSDGRTYQLSECIGRSAVVLAWFPKAFTSG